MVNWPKWFVVWNFQQRIRIGRSNRGGFTHFCRGCSNDWWTLWRRLVSAGAPPPLLPHQLFIASECYSERERERERETNSVVLTRHSLTLTCISAIFSWKRLILCNRARSSACRMRSSCNCRLSSDRKRVRAPVIWTERNATNVEKNTVKFEFSTICPPERLGLIEMTQTLREHRLVRLYLNHQRKDLLTLVQRVLRGWTDNWKLQFVSLRLFVMLYGNTSRVVSVVGKCNLNGYRFPSSWVIHSAVLPA